MLHSWFADGRDPRSLFVRDVFNTHHTLDKVPAAVRPVLEPFLKLPITRITGEGLLSAVSLGELCEPGDGRA